MDDARFDPALITHDRPAEGLTGHVVPAPRAPARQPVVIALSAPSEIIACGVTAMMERHRDRVSLHRLQAADSEVTLHEAWDAESVRELLASPEFLRSPNPVVLSPAGHPSVVRAAVASGARGFVSPRLGSEELVSALEKVRDGQVVVEIGSPPRVGGETAEGLTSREREVLRLVGEGLSNQDIARHLFLTVNTVKSYVRNAYRKIGVRSRVAAVLWTLEHRDALKGG